MNVLSGSKRSHALPAYPSVQSHFQNPRSIENMQNPIIAFELSSGSTYTMMRSEFLELDDWNSLTLLLRCHLETLRKKRCLNLDYVHASLPEKKNIFRISTSKICVGLMCQLPRLTRLELDPEQLSELHKGTQNKKKCRGVLWSCLPMFYAGKL